MIEGRTSSTLLKPTRELGTASSSSEAGTLGIGHQSIICAQTMPPLNQSPALALATTRLLPVVVLEQRPYTANSPCQPLAQAERERGN